MKGYGRVYFEPGITSQVSFSTITGEITMEGGRVTVEGRQGRDRRSEGSQTGMLRRVTVSLSRCLVQWLERGEDAEGD